MRWGSLVQVINQSEALRTLRHTQKHERWMNEIHKTLHFSLIHQPSFALETWFFIIFRSDHQFIIDISSLTHDIWDRTIFFLLINNFSIVLHRRSLLCFNIAALLHISFVVKLRKLLFACEKDWILMSLHKNNNNLFHGIELRAQAWKCVLFSWNSWTYEFIMTMIELSQHQQWHLT